MRIGIMGVIVSVLIGVTFLLLLAPGIYYYDSPAVANSLNFTATNATHNFNSTFFQPLNSTAFGGSNHTSGFFAQVTVFTGLAFVFSQFGSVMLAILNAPRILVYLIATPLSLVGFPIAVISILISLFFSLMLTVIILIGISAWMKFDLTAK